jgi:hypothetical protein
LAKSPRGLEHALSVAPASLSNSELRARYAAAGSGAKATRLVPAAEDPEDARECVWYGEFASMTVASCDALARVLGDLGGALDGAIGSVLAAGRRRLC